jgi:hypothetical protein
VSYGTLGSVPTAARRGTRQKACDALISVAVVGSALASTVEAALAYLFYRHAVLLIAPRASRAVVVALAPVVRGLRDAGATVTDAAGRALEERRSASRAECSTWLARIRAIIAEQIWTVPARANAKGHALR